MNLCARARAATRSPISPMPGHPRRTRRAGAVAIVLIRHARTRGRASLPRDRFIQTALCPVTGEKQCGTRPICPRWVPCARPSGILTVRRPPCGSHCGTSSCYEYCGLPLPTTNWKWPASFGDIQVASRSAASRFHFGSGSWILPWGLHRFCRSFSLVDAAHSKRKLWHCRLQAYSGQRSSSTQKYLSSSG